MLAVSSQTFEDSCRIAQRNSLESATLSLNLFQGFILSFFFFGWKGCEKRSPPAFTPHHCYHHPLLSSQLLLHAARFTHLLFVRHKADYTFEHSYSSKKRIERIGKGQVTMQILVSSSENLKEELDIFWKMSIVGWKKSVSLSCLCISWSQQPVSSGYHED